MNRPQWIVFVICAASSVAGCANDAPRPQKESAPSAKQAVSETAKQAASASPAPAAGGLCSLFTKKEIEELLGAPLSVGTVAGPLGTACQWDGSTDADAIFAQIQVVKDPSYWSKPALAKGYEPLKGVAKEAFVVSEESGWKAQALTDTAVVSVMLNGGKADRDRTVKLLRTLLERLK